VSVEGVDKVARHMPTRGRQREISPCLPRISPLATTLRTTP
jgi:hypothetical protein